MKSIQSVLVLLSIILTQNVLAQETGTVVDSRDGQTYTTIKLGTQWWMSENLNVGTRINGTVNMSNNSIIEKYCYGDNESNCSQYGALYQWKEAMQYSTTEKAKGLCPTGWHIPSDAEWMTLEMYLGMTSLQVNDVVWRGTNQGRNLLSTGTSGFLALLSGWRLKSNGTFGSLLLDTFFWTSTLNDATHAWYRALQSGRGEVNRYWDEFAQGFCIRCLKDDVSSINDYNSNTPAKNNQLNSTMLGNHELYNIQGHKCLYTAPGIYLMRDGNSFRKSLIVD